MNLCESCGEPFDPPKRNPRRRTCSKVCSTKAAWKTNRDGRIASIRRMRSTPEGKALSVEVNRKRWSAPGARERLSEWNRQRWATPEIREQLTAGIRERAQDPDRRAFYSRIRKAMWADPIGRAKMTAAVKASHSTDEYRALFSNLLRERWQDPVWREKWAAGMRRRFERERRLRAAAKAAPRPLLELPPLPPPPVAPERTRSPRQLAEEDAIAEFLAKQGATIIPDIGAPELARLVDEKPLVYDKKTRKYARR